MLIQQSGKKFPTLRFLFLWVLLLAFSVSLYSTEPAGTQAQKTPPEETPPEEPPPNSASALNRLIEISQLLSTLNSKLQNELHDSMRSSRELQSLLESSKAELDTLRAELEFLRITSTELLGKMEKSQTASTELMTALRKAESSLMSLDLSFTAYRETADNRIRSLERQNKFWKIGCIAAGILAAGFGAAFGVAFATGR